MKKQILADLALFAVVIVWGYTFVAIKNALADITPFNFIFIRFTISALFLILIFRKRLRNLDRITFKSGVLIGIFLFLAYAFQTVGLKYTTASNAGFITGFSVVLVPLFSALFIKSMPRKESIAGVVLAVAGLFLLSYSDTSVFTKGDLLVLFCAVAVAFHIISVGYYTVKTDSVLLTVVQIATVAVFSFFCTIAVEEPVLPDTAVVWSAILVTSIFATVGAYLIQNLMQRFTSPTHTALIFAGEPVFAGIFGFILLGERLGSGAVAGCFLILLGMIVSEIRIKSKQTAI